MEGDRYLRCDTNTAAIVHSATSIQSSIKEVIEHLHH